MGLAVPDPHIVVLRQLCDLQKLPAQPFAGLPGGHIFRVARDDKILHTVPLRQLEEQQARFSGVVMPTIGLLHPVADVSAVIDALVMADPQVAGPHPAPPHIADGEMISGQPVLRWVGLHGFFQ